MRIIRLDNPMMLDERLHHPYETYVVPDEVKGLPGTGAHAYFLPYRTGCAAGGNACLYRGGAIGDQFIAMGIARAMANYEGNGRVDAFVPARHIHLWEGLTEVRALPLAPTLDTWRGYRGHVPLDDILSKTADMNGNVYDHVYQSWGVAVEDEFRKPFVKLLEKDQHELGAIGFKVTSPYLLYGIHGSGLYKSYPPHQAAVFIKQFLKDNKDWSVVAVGSEDPPLNVSHSRFHNLQGKTRNVRSLVFLAANAGVVVTPESALLHIASALDRPAVALLGPFGPEHTLKYYKNARALFPSHICPHAPCTSYEQPVAKCKDATNAEPGEQKWCNVIKSIRPDEIAAAVKEMT